MSSSLLVVGGGVAGSALATLLARAGEGVVLFEQQREPRHKMCGEFLSAEACDSLERLGLDLGALGALPLRTLRLTHRAHTAETSLPFPAMSLTRRRLDAELLALAARSGVELRTGARIDGLHLPPEPAGLAHALHTPPHSHSGVRVSISGGALDCGTAAFLASGKHDLRGHARRPPRGPKLVAFKQYFRLCPGAEHDLRGAIELHLFRGGYAGLQMVETGHANLSLLIDQKRLRALGGWPGVLHHVCHDAPRLGARLTEATPVLPQPLALSHIPYGFLAPRQSMVWRVGDQAAVIPSFTGDGIAIALHSARVAAQSYLQGETPAQYMTQLHADLRRNLRRAHILAHLLLTPGVRQLSLTTARRAPALLAFLAEATRIRPRALRRLSTREETHCGCAVRIQ